MEFTHGAITCIVAIHHFHYDFLRGGFWGSGVDDLFATSGSRPLQRGVKRLALISFW